MNKMIEFKIKNSKFHESYATFAGGIIKYINKILHIKAGFFLEADNIIILEKITFSESAANSLGCYYIHIIYFMQQFFVEVSIIRYQ